MTTPATVRDRYAALLLEQLDDGAYTVHPDPSGRLWIEPRPPAELAEDVLAHRMELRRLVRERDLRAARLVVGAEAVGLALWWDEEDADLSVGWHRAPTEAELSRNELDALLRLLEDNERAVENYCRRTGRIGRPEDVLGRED